MKVLAIVGPTASGKSDLAVKLAKQFDGEIISADSRQVYKGLDIGTGKITKREMKGVPHHLLDVAKLSNRPSGSITRFTVADYQKLAQAKIAEITDRRHLPIICGGTGLYIQAALGELNIPPVPPDLKLRQKLVKKPAAELFKLLLKLDPTRTINIDRHNPRRLIRAIEITQHFKLTGGQTSFFNKRGVILDKYHTFWIGLKPGKENLRQKIKARLQKRLRRGLIQEVQDLHQKNKISWKKLEELGLEYRYVSRFLQKQEPHQTGLKREKIESLLKKLELEIWHYAKRQMTWFKRYPKPVGRASPIHWLPSADAINKLLPRIKAWRSAPTLSNTDTIGRSRRLVSKQSR